MDNNVSTCGDRSSVVTSSDQDQPHWDSELDDATRAFVSGKTDEIRRTMTASLESFVMSGILLAQVKERIPRHFYAYAKAEFGLSERTVRNHISLAAAFEGRHAAIPNMAGIAERDLLPLISAPGRPIDTLLDQAEKQAVRPEDVKAMVAEVKARKKSAALTVKAEEHHQVSEPLDHRPADVIEIVLSQLREDAVRLVDARIEELRPHLQALCNHVDEVAAAKTKTAVSKAAAGVRREADTIVKLGDRLIADRENGGKETIARLKHLGSVGGELMTWSLKEKTVEQIKEIVGKLLSRFAEPLNVYASNDKKGNNVRERLDDPFDFDDSDLPAFLLGK
jgi:hypothetical protein